MDIIKGQYLNPKQTKMWASILFLIGLTSLLISAYFLKKNPDHFFFSYLTSFAYALSLSLGGLFLVIIFFLTRAGWSASIRRIPELLMNNIWIVAVLFVPILFGLQELYHWTHLEAVAHDPILSKKAGYLNVPFFFVRSVGYFLIWFWLGRSFFKRSTQQDTQDNKKLTLLMQKRSTYGILLFSLTLTFASIDWFMSLTPHWFSTIFGVYFFAGSVVAALSFTSVVLFLLQKKGYLKNIVTVEHFHDIGKLIYGFNVFWAYIAFSQYFLIWYSNIPEETEFFIHHFSGSWKWVGIALIIGHFVIPFVLFMSRHVKRNIKLNVAFSIWFLMMHFLDLYWLIMPTLKTEHHGLALSWVDLTTFVGVTSIFLSVFVRTLSKNSLFPNNDPRIHQAIHFVNH